MTETESKRPIVLFVDDDQMLLASTRRRMLSMEKDWELHFAESGAAALEVCKSLSPNAVVTDMRMPGTDGVALLTEIQRLFPESIRIILSGQTEKDSMLQAHVVAHAILGKPCDIEAICNLLHLALGLQSRLGNDRIRGIISSSQFLPVSPSSVRDTLALLRAPEISVEQITEIIQNDLGLYGYIIKIVNSSLYGLRSKVLDIDQAILLLGVFPLRTILCSLMLANALGRSADGPLCSQILQSGIRRAQRVSKIARDLQRSKTFEEDCHMAALFQDFGQLVLSMCGGAKYTSLVNESQGDSERLVALEREVFQCTHAEAGAYLLSLWSFSPQIVLSICTHEDLHAALKEPPQSVAECVRLATSQERDRSSDLL